MGELVIAYESFELIDILFIVSVFADCIFILISSYYDNGSSFYSILDWIISDWLSLAFFSAWLITVIGLSLFGSF